MGPWLLSLAVIVVVGCAILAALGFKGRTSTVGIDLGTTFSVVGANINGKVVIFQDETGRNIFPSIVHFDKNGDISVGYNAVKYLLDDPRNTIYDAKRFIGKSLSDSSVQQYANHHPFVVQNIDKTISNFSEIGFRIERKDETSDFISPEKVGSEVLKYLVNLAKTALKHDQVNKAVIAVPAKFNKKQREATAEAYRLAGLKVVRVLEEPTAAAIAYDLHKNSNIHYILVYDFGGGTLDVSILYVSQGSVQVYATDGDDSLGGSDFDICLADYLQNEVESVTRTPLLDTPPLELDDIACSWPKLRQDAERIKRELSYNPLVNFSCQFDSLSSSPRNIQLNISVIQFESVCSSVFEKTMTPVLRLLDELDMTPQDIDEVVLVGGSTRIPRIKEQLRIHFNKDLNDKIDPDITVAYGAAAVLD